MADAVDRELSDVIALERRLLAEDVRRDREALSALLHEEFSEFGASGRMYDRESIIDALLTSAGTSARGFDFRAVRLGPAAVLVTYRTDSPSLRTSIWSRAEDGAWRLRHHQGTRVSA